MQKMHFSAGVPSPRRQRAPPDKGIDKAYGMAKLATASGIAAAETIFNGDARYPGGNDYAVHEASIDTIGVRDVLETRRVSEAIILCLGNASGHS
jgi:hypothetical protein